MNVDNKLSNVIVQTYALLALSIFIHLIGSQVAIPADYYMITLGGSIGLLFAVMFTKNPLSLMAFAFVTGILHYPVFAHYSNINQSLVTEALIITCMLFCGLTLIAMKTNRFNTFAMLGMLYSSLWALLCLTILNIYFFKNTMLDIAITWFSLVVFSAYVIYDTKKLLENPNSNPVTNALQLFLDFVNLLLDLLKLLGYMEKRKGKYNSANEYTLDNIKID